MRGCLLGTGTEGGWGGGGGGGDKTVKARSKLQALAYDILPSTTAVFSYTIGSWKLLANEQFFVFALRQ